MPKGTHIAWRRRILGQRDRDWGPGDSLVGRSPLPHLWPIHQEASWPRQGLTILYGQAFWSRQLRGRGEAHVHIPSRQTRFVPSYPPSLFCGACWLSAPGDQEGTHAAACGPVQASGLSVFLRPSYKPLRNGVYNGNSDTT